MKKLVRWCIIFWIVRCLVVYVMWQVIMNFHTGNAQTTGLADACFKLRQSIEAAADKTWTFLRRRHMALRLASSTFKKDKLNFHKRRNRHRRRRRRRRCYQALPLHFFSSRKINWHCTTLCRTISAAVEQFAAADGFKLQTQRFLQDHFFCRVI